jgi:LysM repeat protein
MGMIIDKCTFMQMNRLFTVLVFLFLGFIAQAQDCARYHLVVKGETLYGIARNNECTVDQLISVNPNMALPLKEGASVCIPIIDKNSPQAQESSLVDYHIVVLGESVYGLSKKYACSIDTLYQLNPTLLETGLTEGQKIRVPAKKTKDIDHQFEGQRNSAVLPSKKIKVALFAPFDDSKPEYFEVALSFLEGVQLAISDWSDSLPAGISLSVYNEFDAFQGFMDSKPSVVLGPFLPPNYARISPEVVNQGIPVFSPFSKQWEPRSKTEFKVNHSEVEAWVAYISGYHNKNRGSSIFLSKASLGKDSLLRAQVAAELRKKGVPFTTCDATGAEIAAQSSSGRESLIALFVSNELRVRNILTGLTRSSVQTKNLQLLVPDEWLNFQVMEIGYYQKFNIQILAPSHYLEFPLDDSSWPERYKALYNAWPDAYAEMGYLLASFTFRKFLFSENGKWVEAITGNEGDMANLRFDFSAKTHSGTGLNRRVRIIGFEQGQVIYRIAAD